MVAARDESRAARAARSEALRSWKASGRQGPRPVAPRPARAYEPAAQAPGGGAVLQFVRPEDERAAFRGILAGLRDRVQRLEADGLIAPGAVAANDNARPAAAPDPTPRLVAIASDIHWGSESRSWAAFRAWHRDVRPHRTILLGDMFDAAAASKHQPHVNDPQSLADEINRMVAEANALAAECGSLTLCIGNHDARVEKYLRGDKPHITKGLKGLTLPEIAVAHGLREDVAWFEETAERPGLQVGQFMLAHGHNGASRFGGGKHLAANAIAGSNGVSRLHGHSHRAQLFCHTAWGKTAIGIANPSMVKPMGYAPNANWQVGWSALLLRPPAFDVATPYVLICDDDGGVSWGNKYYGAAA